ncbi:LOW QUALITY PROTEIN: hypothetical protein V2J09_009085 [Rumex salicifolius]
MERDRSFGAGGHSSSRFASSYEKSGERTRFTVELRPGETTIVSWKKLTKDVPKSNDLIPSTSHPAEAASAPDPSAASGVQPALESRLVPGQPDTNELKDAAGPNRFNSVIEKIERLYMGKDSSDEDLGDIPDDDQYDTEDSFIDDAELDEYFEVDKSKAKHDGFFVNRGKLESIESSLPPNEQLKKRRRKERVSSTEANGLTADGYIRDQGKSGSGHLKNISRKAYEQSEISFQRKEKNGKRELIDLNVAAVKHPIKTSLVHKREGSSFKHKSTMLDKAVRELEKVVAESRPPAIDFQDADGTSQAVKRRLSREIKQKLAKVARIGQVSHGKVSKELLSRLMVILGHLINVRSLKRNLKIMISSSLPVSQEKDDKFQQIKREVVEMIKTYCPPLISKAAELRPGDAENVQESCLAEKGIKVKYNMDPVLEDKICDLYDIFLEGIDEDVAPQARKLYAELAQLWPKGVMDNHGIKRAICHSKERRRTLHDRNKEHGSMKRKKLGAVNKEEAPTSSIQPQDRAFSDIGNHVTNPASPTLGLPAPLSNAQSYERPKHEKVKRSANSSYVEIRAPDGTLVKKKVKRKPESNLGEVHPRKTSQNNSLDRHNSHKQQTQNSEFCTQYYGYIKRIKCALLKEKRAENFIRRWRRDEIGQSQAKLLHPCPLLSSFFLVTENCFLLSGCHFPILNRCNSREVVESEKRGGRKRRIKIYTIASEQAFVLLCGILFCPYEFSKFTRFRPWLTSYKYNDQKLFSDGAGLVWQRRRRRRQIGEIVAAAELSSPLSFNLGLDSQTFDSHDVSELRWIGPIPGDIAEVEAYCRIFRAAESLHSTLMDTLCDPVTGECMVSYESSSLEKPLLEDKIVSVLGCMVSLLNKGRQDVLSGSSTIMTSGRSSNLITLEDKLPPLAIFRGEIKRCCESLHVALESFLVTDNDRSCDVWRKLQRLKNVCYDLGFPRDDDSPEHSLLANWAPVYFSSLKGDVKCRESDVAFWKGGQLTEESLKWLMEEGFKTIVDLRDEIVKDRIYHSELESAIDSGKVELIKLPVEIGMAPSMDQVEKFASLVSENHRRPIYLHSQEGVWRTSAMISRWRQYISRFEPQIVPGINSHGCTSQVSNGSPFSHASSNGRNDGLLKKENESLPADSDGKSNVSLDKLHINPLKAQLPPKNAFSRKTMSRFFKRRNPSPPSDHQTRLLQMHISSEAPKSEVGTSNGRSWSVNLISEHQNDSDQIFDKFNDAEKKSTIPNDGSTALDNGIMARSKISDPAKQDRTNTVGLPVIGEDGVKLLSGDMCASTTGVVRLQSRRKAEMFLVRTDGFSCTREKVTESSLAFTHPSTQQQMLLWKSTPKTVLLLKKLGKDLMEEAKEVASFLYHEEKMNILVEPEVHDMFADIPGFGFVQTFYSQDTSNLHEKVDFVACLGGDGVILHASNLFKNSVPPVVSFNLGSLGFLTSHVLPFNSTIQFEGFKQDLRQVIHGNNTREGVYITLRMRLRCEMYRNGKAMSGKVFDVLNEVVVDRGSNPYLSKIECYEHDRLITKVQGDGVIIATPTGSTAYSTSAGGSMVHPNVPCMLFTPICPHSLSFRPVILPDSARLELKIPEDARSSAWVSFDGKRRQQLSRGDSLRIYMSQYPLPTVNKSDQTCDWFHSLIRCLNWNERRLETSPQSLEPWLFRKELLLCIHRHIITKQELWVNLSTLILLTNTLLLSLSHKLGRRCDGRLQRRNLDLITRVDHYGVWDRLHIQPFPIFEDLEALDLVVLENDATRIRVGPEAQDPVWVRAWRVVAHLGPKEGGVVVVFPGVEGSLDVAFGSKRRPFIMIQEQENILPINSFHHFLASFLQHFHYL